jgi:hypothetical protein
MTTKEERERLKARYAANGHVPADYAGSVLITVTPERVTWVWRSRMAEGKFTVLDGDPGLGKSTAVLDIAARVSRGSPFPGEIKTREPRGVVLLSAEDGLADTIVPRLTAAGADLTRIYAMTGTLDARGIEQSVTIPESIPAIENAIIGMDAALLVIDPLMAYFSQSVNANNDQQVRTALKPLAEMLERTKCSAILIRHMTKSDTKHALYRGGGSIGIIGAARFGLMVARDPDNESSRVIAPTKCNIGPEPPSLRYALESVPGSDVARVVWGVEASPYSAVDLLGAASDDGEAEDRDEAEEWLRHLLEKGPVTAQQCWKDARKQGYGERAIRRAKKRLRVIARPDNFGGDWTWSLPIASEIVRDPWN